MVRWYAHVLLALLPVLLLAPPLTHASAQVDLLADPAGDHGAAGFEEADLLALAGTVEGDEVLLRIQTAGLAAPTEAVLVDSSEYLVHLNLGDAEYELDVLRRITAMYEVQGPVYDLSLYRVTDGGRRPVDVELDATEETDAGAVTVAVPRGALVDEAGLPLLPGARLDRFWVESSNEADSLRRAFGEDGVPAPAATVHDRMPDDGTGGGLGMTVEATGGAVTLLAESPVRTSNGGPGTFVYLVRAHNGGPDALEADLLLEGAPEAWGTRVVPDHVALEPGDVAEVRVVVEAQGAHGHGGQDVFRLTAGGADGAGVADVDLALHYLDVPQPAGHHDEVWFHSARASNEGSINGHVDDAQAAGGYPKALLWLNTLQEDEADASLDAVFGHVDEDPEGPPAWRMDLSPALSLGLQTHDAPGEVVVPLRSSQPTDLSGVVVSARLRVLTADGPVDVALAPSSAPVTLGPARSTEVVLPLAAVVGQVPYEPDNRLVLDVLLEAYPTGPESGFSANVPVLAPGGHARLPLDDYRDPLPPELEATLRDAGVLDEDGALVGSEAPATARDSPGVPAALLVVAVAGVALRRRRST